MAGQRRHFEPHEQVEDVAHQADAEQGRLEQEDQARQRPDLPGPEIGLVQQGEERQHHPDPRHRQGEGEPPGVGRERHAEGSAADRDPVAHEMG